MGNFNYPFRSAFKLAKQMRELRAKTEETAYSETNHQADLNRAELVRQIDWRMYQEVIDQLEFCYKQQLKTKP